MDEKDYLIPIEADLLDSVFLSPISDEVDLPDSITATSNTVNEAAATRAGIQTQSLQAAMDNYAAEMNKSAIVKSTGLPVRTPAAQYKGFAAEEFLKNTGRINALAKGVPDYKIGIYTKGELPNGTVLSGIDMQTDISIWTRKRAWSKPARTVDYQSKVYNDASKYAKAQNNPQYAEVEFVGGSGQGVNDVISFEAGGKRISSDTKTPEGYTELAEQMKQQNTPEYAQSKEKLAELNKVNLGRAVAAGAIAGGILSMTSEIVNLIKKGNGLSEEDFVKSIEHIFCGTVEGGARGGAIMGSVQLVGRVLGKEIPANSLGAVPVMAAANFAIDLGKDLFRCFVSESIDADDLLCNSVNNLYASVAGFSGGYAGGELAGLLVSAKASAATGAAIGSAIGPIGTIIGSVVGGFVIGLGANAVVGVANKDAIRSFNACIEEVNSQIELSGCERYYYFADTMSELSDFRFSFKDLLPCYNLISDLKEYNLKKKKLKEAEAQLDTSAITEEKKKVLARIAKQTRTQIAGLEAQFWNQRALLIEDFRASSNTYVSNSYAQYLDMYSIISGEIGGKQTETDSAHAVYCATLDAMRLRNKANQSINEMLSDILEDSESERLLKPFIEKLRWVMQQDQLLVGRQYLSLEEALGLVR